MDLVFGVVCSQSGGLNTIFHFILRLLFIFVSPIFSLWINIYYVYVFSILIAYIAFHSDL